MKGLYVQRYASTGQFSSVQCADGTGIEIPVDPQHYQARGYLPPIEQLPSFSEYHARIVSAPAGLIGKKVRFSLSGVEYVGVIEGEDNDGAVIATSPETTERAYTARLTDGSLISFALGDKTFKVIETDL